MYQCLPPIFNTPRPPPHHPMSADDPSYQNTEAFGFFIDVGNGLSTIPPSILLNYAIIYGPSGSASDTITPLLVGCICIASLWQITYGTIIYFLSFVWNKRYQDFRAGEIWTFVGLSNSCWIVFPAVGIWACVQILRDGSFDVFAWSITIRPTCRANAV